MQLDYTTHLFVDISLNPATPVLFLSGIMSVMDFSHEVWGFQINSFFFCRNLSLAQLLGWAMS